MSLSWIGPIVRGVVTVPDLGTGVAAYRDGLGFSLLDIAPLGPATAARWGAPGVAGAPCALLAPASGTGGGVVLVEQPPTAGYAPMRTLGWAALELSVGSIDAVRERADAHFRVLCEPAPLTGPAGPSLRAAQVVGPGGEVLYLTEIRAALPPFVLPERPPTPDAVDGVYVAVLAAADLVTTRAWWEDRFPVRRCSDRMGAIAVINRAFGLPADTTHRLSSLQLSGRAVVEIDQYPSAAVPRPVSAGLLPPGVALVSFAVGADGGVELRSDLGTCAAGAALLRAPDGALVELAQPPDLLTS